MTEQLQTSILKLRAAVLARRVQRKGFPLSVDDAQRWVNTRTDKEAYRGALDHLEKQTFWSRFWWNR